MWKMVAIQLKDEMSNIERSSARVPRSQSVLSDVVLNTVVARLEDTVGSGIVNPSVHTSQAHKG